MLGGSSASTLRAAGIAGAVVIGLVLAFSRADGSSALVYPLFFLVAGAAAVASAVYRHKRAAALREWAQKIGWTYVGSDSSLTGRWRGEPFGRGHSQGATEVITGAYGGHPAVSFAYRFTTGSGKNRQTHEYHVVAMAMPAWLPTVQLTPEGIGSRVVSAFGGQDLEFESEEFNRLWRVEARDPRYASDVLHPRTLERLVRPDARGLSLRIEGSDVLCWSPGLPDVETLATRLGVMRALVTGVPRHVWLDHGFDPARIPTVPERTW